MSQQEINASVDPDRLRAVSIEDFEIKEYRIVGYTVRSGYAPCKLYTANFKDGEKRRYLVCWNGRYLITKELENGFWVDDCASPDCLSNVYWNGKWITKTTSILADKKDINFIDWVREKL